MIHLLSQPPKLLRVQFIVKHILGSIVLQNSCAGQGEVCREGIVCPARQKGWEHVCRQRERRSRMVTVPKCIKKRQGLLWGQKIITEERWMISADHCVNDPSRSKRGGEHQAVTRPEKMDELSQCTISSQNWWEHTWVERRERRPGQHKGGGNGAQRPRKQPAAAMHKSYLSFPLCPMEAQICKLIKKIKTSPEIGPSRCARNTL